ncbi:MAG: ArsA-related P-loop ATPase [Myxococcota bacterium]
MSSGPSPKVIVCAGGGGVGKTTTSAAIALSLAQRGQRTLVVTVDPARRLAQAMGVHVGPDVEPAKMGPDSGDRLFALMPEPRQSTQTFIEILFEDQPDALERMMKNRIYHTLGDAVAGIHEMVSLMLVARAVEERDYDYLVVDTAPSRYALDFVSYPGKIASLFEGRAVGWFGNLAQKARAQGREEEEAPPADSGGLLAWGKKRVEATLARILDPRTIQELTDLFAELALVRHRFASLARTSESLMLGPRTHFLLVAAPTGAAAADVDFIARRLGKLRHKPTGIILNKSDPVAPEWLTTLEGADGLTLPVQQALEIVRRETDARRGAGDRAEKRFRSSHRGAEVLRLPTIEVDDPSDVVRKLADDLGAEVEALVAR